MEWICHDCGERYGKYREDLLSSTWHHDWCDYCGEWKVVTENRDYGYPEKPDQKNDGGGSKVGNDS